jgi:hypothetical protein
MAKKNLLKLAVVVVLTMAAASSVYAATATLSGSTSVGGSSFSSSNKVSAYYVSDSAVAGFAGTAYGIAAAHFSGDKTIASNHSDAKLFFSTTTPGNATTNAAAIATNTDFTVTSTWTSM